MLIPAGYKVTLKHSDGRTLRITGPQGRIQPTTIDYLYETDQPHTEYWELSNGRMGREGHPDLPAVVVYYKSGAFCQEIYYRGRTGQIARHVIYSEEGMILKDMDYSWKWTK